MMTADLSLVGRIANLSPEKRVLLEQKMTSSVAVDGQPRALGDVETAPTTYAQRSQWFVNRLSPDNPFFNKTDAVRVRGHLDIAALGEALTALVTRHAVLRTGYRTTDDGPVQVVHPPTPVDVPVVDIPAGPRQMVELQRHLAAGQRRAFDLERGPMYRVELIRLGPDDHVLARTNHHIAFDRWSTAVANAELSALYAAFASGETPALDPLPYQYTDFAVWQQEHLDPATIDRHLEFARAHLAGVPQILDLPTDHPRPKTQAHQGASYHTRLDPALVARIRHAARAGGATPFMFSMAGFGALIGRYARSEHFLLGVPAAGRNAPGSDSLIGLFINSMVMRLDLRGGPSFSELVSRVRTASLGALSHQDLPFETLVENLATQRAPGRTPVFQVMFDYINTPGANLVLGDLDLEPIAIADEASVYDISLYLYDDGTDIAVKWEYRSDLFDRPTIVRMAEAYATLLEAAVADPTLPAGELALVSDEDRQRIRALGTGSPASGVDFLSSIGRQVSERPDETAVVSGEGSLSYRDLWDLAMGVSEQIDATCDPSGRVAVLTGRAPGLVPALIGVLHSGRTAVMVDTSQPGPRVEAMLSAAGIDAFITAGAGFDTSTLGDVPEIPLAPGEGSRPPATSGAPAYLIFTSGSTGTPRGVLVGRPALANLVADACDRYALSPSDRVLQFASPGFDTLFEEVLPTLASGATLVMRPQELFATFANFADFVADYSVSVLDLPTAWWHAWVDDMARTGDRQLPESLRLVIIGGEAASADRWRQWSRIAGGVRLVNTYGPSETTVVVSAFEPRPGWVPESAYLPIGRPIANTRLVVVDPGGAELPLGVPGELVVEGPSVGDGYLDEQGRTSGFEESVYGRRYRTGDLARMSVDGTFEYLGRIDDQVKISGVRIEPGEIEEVLKSHPAIEDAVVVTLPGDGGVVLVGHVVSSVGVDENELRCHLADRLPPLMVPGSVIVHAHFPLTISGKIDRRALLALSEPGPSQRRAPIDRAPTPTEERMGVLWEKVVGQGEPALDDDFFSVGGHSLLGVRLISHASDEFGVSLPLRIIYEAPTLAAMAAWVDRELEGKSLEATGAG